MNATADIETLWHDHHAKLTRYVRHRFPAHLVEDMVQDVYLSALEAMHRGNGYRESASGWIHRMAHNAVVDAYRAWGREPETVELDALQDDDTVETNRPTAEALTVRGLTPHELAEQAELAERVRAEIDTLSEDQQFVMRHRMAGYDYDELAELLGRNKGATKAVQVRAYICLRKQLRDLHEGELPVRVRRSSEFPEFIVGLFQTHGPMTSIEAATKAGCDARAVQAVISNYRTRFTPVGVQPIPRHNLYIWGLVGLHDQPQKESNA